MLTLKDVRRPSAKAIRKALDRLPTIQEIAALLVEYEYSGAPTEDNEIREFARVAIRDAAAVHLLIEQMEAHPTLRDDVGYRALVVYVAVAARHTGLSFDEFIALAALAYGRSLDPPPVH